jgi:hypothetical protein
MNGGWGTWVKVTPVENKNLPTQEAVDMAHRMFASLSSESQNTLLKPGMSTAKKVKALREVAATLSLDPMFLARLAEAAIEKPVDAGHLLTKMLPKEGGGDVIINAPVIAVPTQSHTMDEWRKMVEREVAKRKDDTLEGEVLKTTDLTWDPNDAPLLKAPIPPKEEPSDTPESPDAQAD